jgi:hypothetical protein
MRTLIVGDIHGCFDELLDLLIVARYNPKEDQLGTLATARAPRTFVAALPPLAGASQPPLPL